MIASDKISTCILKERLNEAEFRLWKNLDYGVKENRLIIVQEGHCIPMKITRGKTFTEFNLYQEGYQKLSHDEAMNCTEVHTHPPMLGELMSTWVLPEAVDVFSTVDLEAIASREHKIPHKLLLPPGKRQRVIAKKHIYTMNRVGEKWPADFLRASQDIDQRINAIREHLLARKDLDRIKMSNHPREVNMLMEAQATFEFIAELARAGKIDFIVWTVVE